MLLLPVFLVAVVALILGATASVSWGWGGWGGLVELDEAEIFFEENTTDEDLGIQFFLDGKDWKCVTILTPDWKRLVKVRVSGSAGVIGLTEFFSESAEPGYENEAERQAFLDLFDAGEYKFFGVTVEGEILVGEATLTKDIPAPPNVTTPDKPEDPEEGDPTDISPIVWDAGGPDIVGYEVVAELVLEVEDEEIVYVNTATLPGTATMFTASPEFVTLAEDDDVVEAKIEVIAIEGSGNKAITEVIVFELPEENGD